MKALTVEVQRLTERNKRTVAVNQSYIKVSNNKKFKSEHDRICILYKYCGGYLLFELNQEREPVRVWRDFNRGKFPLKTHYIPFTRFTEKIQQFAPTVIYTNDAEPLKNLTFTYTLKAFFIPIHDLLQSLLIPTRDIKSDTIQQSDFRDSLPTFENIKELDPYITYKEYKQIYSVF